MHSQCGNDGAYTLNVTFKHGVNPDFAQVLVRNRVNLAHPVLPDAVKKTGITVRKRSLNAVMFVVVSSPDNSRDILYLGNYANIHLRDELARLPGVGDITVIGAREFGMRICLDLERMAACNVTVSDVTKAIKEQPVADLQQIENINLKADPDRMVRLKDVARAELGMDYPASFARLNGKPVVVMGVYPMPLSSPRELNVAVQNKLSELRGLLPNGIAVDVAFNFTPNLVASNLGTPPEYLRLDISLPDGVSVERTQEAVKHCEQLLNEVAGVQDILALSVPPFTASSNQAGILLHLAPAKQRQANREQLMQTIRARLRDGLPEAQARVCDVTKSSRFPLGGYPIELAIQGPEPDKVRRLARELADRLRQSEKLTDVGTSAGAALAPNIDMTIDRARAKRLGVSMEDIDNTLRVHRGAFYVKVNVQVDADARKRIDDLSMMLLRNDKGEIVPLAAVVEVHAVDWPVVAERFNMNPMVGITANPAPGVSLKEARSLCETLAQEVCKELGVSAEYRLTWMQEP